MKTIIFLSSIVPLLGAENYSGISIAGNKMEYHLIDELKSNISNNYLIKAISTKPVAAWPQDKKIFYKKDESFLENGQKVINVGFLNIPYLKQYAQQGQVYKEIEMIVKDKNPDDFAIIIFNCFPQVGYPAMRIKEKYGIKVISMLADLPIDVIKRGFLGKWFRRVFDQLTIRIMHCCDGLIVLNKTVMEDFSLTNEYMVCEGGYEGGIEKPERYTSRVKSILFTGTLNEYNGILELIDAFLLLNQEKYELHIYGDGPLRDTVIKHSKQNARIKYYGLVPNGEVLMKQREAFVLINPRPTNDKISRVTFPSKLFEYVVSGRPVISTMFKGVPSEYENYIYFIEDNNPVNIANMVQIIDEETEDVLLERGRKAQEFIQKEKSWRAQGEKIASFVDRIAGR